MPETFYARVGKRLLDLFVSAVALIVLSPLLLVLAILVKLTSRGPVFFHQTRVGLRGQNFEVVKFRSMVVDAESMGPQITSAGDSRVTSIGRILRKTKLDELPQLWNVFRGQMSFVGPRPELPKYVEMYTSEQRRILAIRPGVTSPASVTFRHEEILLASAADRERFYRETLIPAKTALDLQYLEAISFPLDLLTIIGTVTSILQPHDSEKTESHLAKSASASSDSIRR